MFDRIKSALFVSITLLMIVMPAVGAGVDPAFGDDDDKKKKAIPEDVIRGWVVVKLDNASAVSLGASKTGISSVDRVAERFEVRSVQKMFPMLDGLPAGKQASIKGLDRLTSVYKLEIDEEMNPFVVASALQALPEVEYAEPLFKMQIAKHFAYPSWMEAMSEPAPLMATPNDALFANQSHLTHIFIPEAWDVVKGEQGDVVVSILDGGTEWQHADLQANVFINPNEVPDNGVDDDNNGLIDDVNGWNFSSASSASQGDNDPTGDRDATPANALHGTETAGIVAALTNNSSGIAGVTWNAKVLPVNISCPDADRSLCFSYSGLVYSLLMDVDIVSASFGSDRPSSLIRSIVESLYENGSLVVASAGNNGTNNDLFPQYPANYDNVLSVGWTGKNFDVINSGSNFGISVDVFAPGSNIDATGFNNQYTSNASGTSFSAPLAAGLAALVKTQNPEWNIDQVREQVRVTADDISTRNTSIKFRDKLGKGRVNAQRAVTEASPAVRIRSAQLRDVNGSSRIGPGEGATLEVELINHLEPISSFDVSLESSSPFVTITTPTVSGPSLGTGETASAEFSLFASADVPFNEPIALMLNIDGGDYTDADIFSVVVNITNHSTGEVEMTLNPDGNLGYEGFQGETRGTGFTYKGVDYMFEGGMIMGSGAGKIADNIRGTSGFNQTDDFIQVEGSEFGIDDGRVTTEEGRLDLLDSQAPSPNNVRVRLDSYADTTNAYNDFIVLRYTIENVGATQIDNFHMGLFFDWDSPSDPGADNAAFDAGRRMGMFQDGASGVYVGTKLLSTDATVNYRSVDNELDLFEDGFTEAEKFAFISGGIQTTTLTGRDVSTLTSGGPYSIPVDGNIEIAYALIGGETLDELNTHADAAQQLWEDSIQGLGPNPVSNEDPDVGPSFEFALADPYPNPVRDEAVIQYEVPTSGSIALSIYDILGREVRTLVDESVRAGKHTITWDARDNNGNALASGMYLVTLTSPTNEGVKTETRKMIVLR
ncbi:MAG: S8 family serine peptidase [Rhodothermaceae bacterium]|nr:S8 family serine peptidase [Rhodothermaceae bacterium]